LAYSSLCTWPCAFTFCFTKVRKEQNTMVQLIKHLILGQRIIPYIGAVKNLLASIMFYVGMLNFVMIAAMFYRTFWLELWIFIAIIAVIIIIAMIIEYKFVIPSTYSFGNTQGYIHNSPLVADLQKALKKLEELEKLIKEQSNVK
jgi:hypothetical protein